MIKVAIFKERNYPISSVKVKSRLLEVLKRSGIDYNCSVSLAFVGKRKMEELVKKYYKGDPQNLYVHPILTFPYNDKDELGEIIISYDDVDSEKNLLDLVEHGAMHLIGKHHD
ncbi:hypothetical protein A2803_05010 [Candidatus Woesebacteria bacterium RIFCSPHIGHO2_01_FULL_44_21]|uniref:rRNA maturation RNase YbeY n=1 Tax=Candidatus Woesebacteria bacterium RIFCSPHIGHO2_01_FULL_44_21 TaxID=1802503 RepID=A0A1F7Z0E1_9BACT|nr:MAG: hypothetical protein A2803_05010 [Candidatus Woesebacteria bacterium RIFCSPHIGHO2_01_FULL_44_21]OGM68905.1 MAG: hypothetical protein A2897_01965 [Candidatus Woesebacteria bacterium RIFCSPLOWO2_01_FULL_44_24b]